MKTNSILICTLLLLSISSCEDFVSVEPPTTQLVKATVFSDNTTAEAAILGIYNQLIFTGCASGDLSSISFLTTLSSDEQLNYNTTSISAELKQFNENGLAATGTRVTGLWSQPYQFIYKANAVIEGLAGSTGVNEDLKKRFIAEAKFIRAFGHFYLVNLFGDVPLILTTDWEENLAMSRTPVTEVYAQIIADLNAARADLPETYSLYGNERARLNKSAASAFLARVYLYRENWQKAEEFATEVISNSSLYGMVSTLPNVFLKNSQEAIWQLARNNANTWDASLYSSTTTPRNAAFTATLRAAFEPADRRFTNWVRVSTVGSTTYHQPSKYKASGTTITEYTTIFRLAEQYLIRSEARAKQGNTAGAIADLDAVRSRAGLPLVQSTNPGIPNSALLLALEHERQVELFTEWGHRWFDLKRTNRLDVVMTGLKPGWQSTDKLYPIPLSQLQNSPSMADSQNPGY